MKITRDVLEQLILEELENMDEAGQEQSPSAALKSTGLDLAKSATRIAPSEAEMLDSLIGKIMNLALQPGDMSKVQKIRLYSDKLQKAIADIQANDPMTQHAAAAKKRPGPATLSKGEGVPGPATLAKGEGVPGPATLATGAGPTRRPRE